MRKFRQFVALIIAMATIATLLTFSVTSVSAQDSLPDITITDQDYLLIEKLEALGVITNDYAADSYVTRRQMSEIIKTYMGLPAGSSGSGDNKFNDVAETDPSYGAISTLRDLEVITGDENNNFNPDNYLNYNEAVVFIINAVGHKYFAVREGGFPTGYMRVAIKHDMLEGINMTNGTSYVPVIDIYRMLDAALDAATIIPQYYGDGSVRYTISETDTFLSETYGIYKYRGQVTGNEFTSLTSSKLEITDEQIEIDNVIYDTPGYVYGYFLGYTVDYYVKHSSTDGEVLVYVEETPKKNSTIQIDSEDILTAKVTSDRIYYEDENYEEEHINIDGAADVIYNSQSYTGYGVLRNIMPANGYVEALDNDSDGVYEVLFIYDYTVAIVDSVDLYNETVTDRLTGDVAYTQDNVRKVNVISAEHNVSVPFDSIKAGDVLSVARGRGTEKIITVYVNTEKVTGKITGYASNLGYEIDGVYYEPTYNYQDDELRVGLSGEFSLDMNGKIAGYKYSTAGDTAVYGAMAGVDYNEQSKWNLDIKVKLYTRKGAFLIAPLANSVNIDGTKYDLGDMAEALEVLDILCASYKSGEKYTLNDSYIVRYTLASDGSVSYIDTDFDDNDVTPIPGMLHSFAENFGFSAARENVVLLAESNQDKYCPTAIYAGVSSSAVIFMTPAAGNLSDETGYNVFSWKDYHSYHNAIGAHSSLSGKNATLIDNFTVYNSGSGDVDMVEVMIARGGSAAAAIGDDSPMYIVTEIADSVDVDSNRTKTLYAGETKLGQLAQSIDVTELGTTTTYASIEAFIEAGVLGDGTVIRIGTDANGLINQIAPVSSWDVESKTLTGKFDGDGVHILNHALPLGSSGANLCVAENVKYDSDNDMLYFETKHNSSSDTCESGNHTTDGKHKFVCNMNWIASVQVYEDGKIRTVTASEIRDGDKCVIRLNVFTRVSDIIIFR